MIYCDYPILREEKELPLYLENMGLQRCQDHIIRQEGYSFPQILYSTKGSGVLVVDGEKHPVPPGSAIFLPACYPHEYYADGDIWDIHWVVPSGYAADDILRKFGLEKPQVYQLSDTRTLEHIFRKMHDAIRADSIYGNMRASGYLYDFLIEFYRLISPVSTAVSTSPALMRAIDHINYSFASPITMEDLCRVSGVSKQHLCLLFRNILKLRPMEYVAKRRIQEAKALLTSTDSSIEEIAETIGFGSESYFCKLFKRYEGITPSAFRNTK